VKHARELEDFNAALDAHAIVAITDARGTISKWLCEKLLCGDHRIIEGAIA
jgi:hypothetical protein